MTSLFNSLLSTLCMSNILLILSNMVESVGELQLQVKTPNHRHHLSLLALPSCLSSAHTWNTKLLIDIFWQFYKNGWHQTWNISHQFSIPSIDNWHIYGAWSIRVSQWNSHWPLITVIALITRFQVAWYSAISPIFHVSSHVILSYTGLTSNILKYLIQFSSLIGI